MTHGRPLGSKLLTNDLIDKIEASILEGVPLYIAGELHEILRNNVQLWMTNGLKFSTMDPADMNEAQLTYVAFFVRIKKAQATWQANTIKRASKDDNNLWARDITMLERRDREHWTKGERRELTGKDGGPLTVAAVELSDDELAATVKRGSV